MRVLVDTHILLWAVASPERLSDEARHLLEDPGNDILFSAASIWEIAIKAQIGHIALKVSPAEIAGAAIDIGFDELPVLAAHAAAVGALPMHHRDPFDRLLVAQAMREPARLMTADRVLTRYSDLVDLVE